MHGIAFEKQQAAELAAEFGMDVWVDLRTRADGAQHWHARKSGWSLWQTISGHDRDHLRDKLIRHKWLTEQAESLVDDAEPGATTATG